MTFAIAKFVFVALRSKLIKTLKAFDGFTYEMTPDVGMFIANIFRTLSAKWVYEKRFIKCGHIGFFY